MSDDLAAALDEAVRATGVDRYRWLCSDANAMPAPHSRDDWRRWVLDRRWAAQALPEAGRPPVARSLALARAMRACPFRSTDRSCGCSGGRCALRRGAPASHLDCFACLETYG